MDYFDRQKRIPNWNQEIIEKQICLCLGCGGLGSTVSLDLVRLGVGKLYIIDKDIIDFHNLNRQLLFSKEDIGKKKVDVAYQTLQKHNLRTEIIPLHLDVLQQWDKIVEISKECTVIFNMIDVGDYFDLAVQSLALKRNIPFCLGGTFRTTLTVDFYGSGGNPCWKCVSDIKDKKMIEKLKIEKITEYSKLDFLPKDNNPIGASNVFVCSTCCNLMVSLFIQNLMEKETKIPTRLIFYYETYEIDKWLMEPTPNCPLCSK